MSWHNSLFRFSDLVNSRCHNQTGAQHLSLPLQQSPACTGRYGADLDAQTPKGWTPLSYAVAKGKYGATEEKGVYPEVWPLCAIAARHSSPASKPQR